MNKLIFAITCLITISSSAQLEWVFTPTATDTTGAWPDAGRSLTSDSDLNVYVTGEFKQTIDFENGPGTTLVSSNGQTDVFVKKLDPAGNLIWVISIGGAQFDQGNAIAVDSANNVFVSGYYEGDVDFDPGPGVAMETTAAAGLKNAFILKLDPNGNFVWVRTIGTSFWAESQTIAIDNSQNLAVTGAFYGAADLDPGLGSQFVTTNGYDDIFILMLDNDGNTIYAKSVGGINSEDSGSSCFDDSNNLYVSGWFSSSADFDPGPGVATELSHGGSDGFVLKLNPQGDYEWSRSFGGHLSDEVNTIKTVGSNVYLGGVFKDTVDFDPSQVGYFEMVNPTSEPQSFILKLTDQGDFVWAKHIKGGNNIGESMDVNSLGEIYFTGSFYDTIDVDPGAAIEQLSVNDFSTYFLKLDPNGNYVWSGRLSGDDNFGCYPSDLHIDANDNILLTGRFYGEVDFDPSPGITNETCYGQDIFVLKLGRLVGVADLDDLERFKLYPNPSQGVFTIDSPSDQFSEFNVSIMNSLGDVIYTNKFYTTPASIAMENVPSGIYFAEIQTENYQKVMKLVVN